MQSTVSKWKIHWEFRRYEGENKMAGNFCFGTSKGSIGVIDRDESSIYVFFFLVEGTTAERGGRSPDKEAVLPMLRK